MLENFREVLNLVGQPEAGRPHIQNSKNQRGEFVTSMPVKEGFLVEGASLCFCTPYTTSHTQGPYHLQVALRSSLSLPCPPPPSHTRVREHRSSPALSPSCCGWVLLPFQASINHHLIKEASEMTKANVGSPVNCPHRPPYFPFRVLTIVFLDNFCFSCS